MDQESSPTERESIVRSHDSAETQQYRFESGGTLVVSSLGNQFNLAYNGHGLTPAESSFVCRLIDKAKGLA